MFGIVWGACRSGRGEQVRRSRGSVWKTVADRKRRKGDKDEKSRMIQHYSEMGQRIRFHKILNKGEGRGKGIRRPTTKNNWVRKGKWCDG